ncbi:hypothetical protein ACWCXB_17165 [Streptomyces sp. NPDC001514]
MNYLILNRSSLALRPRPRLLRKVPDEWCRIRGVTESKVAAQAGARLRHATASMETVASALVVRTTRAEVERTLDELKAWVEAGTGIEPESPANEASAEGAER